MPLEEGGDGEPGSWNGEQSFGSHMQYLPLVLVPVGREFRSRRCKTAAVMGKKKRVEKAQLAKKPKMPLVCLDEIRDRRANKRTRRLGPISEPRRVVWESLSNQPACSHEINSGKGTQISSPDTIRLVLDSQVRLDYMRESEP